MNDAVPKVGATAASISRRSVARNGGLQRGLLRAGAGRALPGRGSAVLLASTCVKDAVVKVGATAASIDCVPAARNGGLQRGLLRAGRRAVARVAGSCRIEAIV